MKTESFNLKWQPTSEIKDYFFNNITMINRGMNNSRKECQVINSKNCEEFLQANNLIQETLNIVWECYAHE